MSLYGKEIQAGEFTKVGPELTYVSNDSRQIAQNERRSYLNIRCDILFDKAYLAPWQLILGGCNHVPVFCGRQDAD